MMRKVEFVKDFATKKKGEAWECDPMLASQLVHIDKVAVYVAEDQEEKPKRGRKPKDSE